jgi:anti-sigma regulatory factor (Ser/Thr protein kinase)
LQGRGRRTAAGAMTVARSDSPGESRVFEARLATLPQLAAFVEAFCARERIDREAALRLNLILEELFTNSVEHGYGRECEGPIRIALSRVDERVAVVYEDAAYPYDVRARLSETPADLAAPLESRQVGGLGVYLVGRLVGSARYAHEDGFNRLWLTVPIDRGATGEVQ